MNACIADNPSNMNPEELRRLQLSQQQRAASMSASARSGQEPNAAMRQSTSQQRASYRINSNVYSRYRPTKAASYRHKSLTKNDILKALSQGLDRPPMFLPDYKSKWEKLQSKEGMGIRMYLDPYMKKHEEPERVKTHHDFMMDEAEFMNVDFREEKKLKKSLCTRFVHEISNARDNPI